MRKLTLLFSLFLAQQVLVQQAFSAEVSISGSIDHLAAVPLSSSVLVNLYRIL